MTNRFLTVLAIVWANWLMPGVAIGGSWSEAAIVWRGATRCVSYRARLLGDHVVVEATHAPDWHTYAMDNRRRAAEKLAGKPSLGIEQPTTIDLGTGLKAIGPWFQSPPRDMSRPELRWFTWGYEKVATFAVKVERTGMPQSVISIKGQACDSKSCQNVNVRLQISVADRETAQLDSKVDFERLVRVVVKSPASEGK